MSLSTQLRIILLLVGAITLAAIYFWGRRKADVARPAAAFAEESVTTAEHDDPFAVDELDEDELETPAYMRRQGVRETRQDYEPRIADADDYLNTDYRDTDEVRDSHAHFVDIAVQETPLSSSAAVATYNAMPVTMALDDEPAYAEPLYAEPHNEVDQEPTIIADSLTARVVATDEPTLEKMAAVADVIQPSAIPVMADPVSTPSERVVRTERVAASMQTPTLSQAVHKPTNNTGTTRRKIIALRLPMPERVSGSQLLPLFQQEHLQHGKFGIFHRLHDTATVFSVASIVEPGAFNTQQMPEQQFPGVTLFMLLPGPLDGLVAYDQMLSSAQRLAHATGAVLHDERGSKLTTQGMERLREEVLDFQHLIGGVAVTH